MPVALACSVAGATAVWTPIACGCDDLWPNITWAIERRDLPLEQLNARVIADGLAKVLSGKVVSQKDLPYVTSLYDCAVALSPTRTVRCRWWIWESSIGQKGYDVVVFTTEAGLFQRVTVTPIVHTK